MNFIRKHFLLATVLSSITSLMIGYSVGIDRGCSRSFIEVYPANLPLKENRGQQSEYDYFTEAINFLDEIQERSGKQLFVSVTKFTTDERSRDAIAARLKQSFGRLKAFRRTQGQSPKDDLLLAIQYLVHGEMLALSPMSRVCSSYESIENGLTLLDSQADTVQSLEQSDPQFGILVETILARREKLERLLSTSEKAIVAENLAKTELLGKFRTTIEAILNAESRFQIGLVKEASESYDQAAQLLSDLETNAENFGVANDERNSRNRRPFLFVAESLERNDFESTGQPFLNNPGLSKTVQRVKVISSLNAIMSSSMTAMEKLDELGKLEIEKANGGLNGIDAAWAHHITGVVLENKMTVYMEHITAQGKATSQDLDEIKALSDQCLKAFQSAKEKLASVPNVDEPITRFVSTRLNRGDLRTAENDKVKLQRAIEAALSRTENSVAYNDTVESSLHDRNGLAAWKKVEELVGHFPLNSGSWEVYVRTGIWTQQNAKMLSRSLDAAESLGVFSNDASKLLELRSLVRLHVAREELYSDHQMVKQMLDPRQAQLIGPEKFATIRGELQKAVDSLSKINQGNQIRDGNLPENRLGAEFALVNSHLLMLGDKQAAQTSKELETKIQGIQFNAEAKLKDPNTNESESRQWREILAMSLEAEGLAMINGGSAEDLETGLAAIAKANDLYAFVAPNPQASRSGSVILAAVLKRNSTVSGESRDASGLRYSLQLLSEGLLLKELKGPEAARVRLARASTRLAQGANDPAGDPIGYVWSLLTNEGREELNTSSASRTTKLMNLLVAIDSSSPKSDGLTGEVAFPSSEQADEVLREAFSLCDLREAKVNFDSVGKALANCKFAAEALSLGLACEAKARSCGLSPFEERRAWLKLSQACCDQARELASSKGFEARFPVVMEILNGLALRLSTVDFYAQRLSESLDLNDRVKATEILYDALLHHDQATHLWEKVVLLVLSLTPAELTRLNSAIGETSAEGLLQQWSLIDESFVWQRSLAESFVQESNPVNARETLVRALNENNGQSGEADLRLRTRLAEIIAF